MGRAQRVHFEGAIYHIVVRGNNRAPVFLGDTRKSEYLSLLAEAIQLHKVLLHAFTLMTNHAHLLLQVSSIPIGVTMHRIQARYARRQNWLSGGTGHVFEKRYWHGLCDCDGYLLNVLRYIHRNPVAAGIVESVDDYPWTSHHAYMGRPNPLVTTSLCLGMFGRSRDAVESYRRFIGASAPAKWPHNCEPPIDEAGNEFAPVEVPVARQLPEGLKTMLAAFAEHAGTTPDALTSNSKARPLVRLRAEFVRLSLSAGFSLADAARVLRKAKSTLSAYGRN